MSHNNESKSDICNWKQFAKDVTGRSEHKIIRERVHEPEAYSRIFFLYDYVTRIWLKLQ